MNMKLSILLLALSVLFTSSVASAFDVTSGMTGAWYDPTHDGEGYVLQVFDDSKAVVFWFTYDPSGKQYWMLGVGEVIGSKITIDSLDFYKGGKFGPGFDPDDVERSRWGSLEFNFSSCTEGTATYQGPSNFGNGSLDIKKLSSVWGLDCSGTQQAVAQSGDGLLKPGFSGAWYDPSHDGEGFTVEVLNSKNALIFWFTYDTQGNPAWMLSVGEIEGGSIFLNDIDQPYGALFGSGFNPSDVVRKDWGQAVFTFGSCTNGGMRYSGPASYGPESTQSITKLVGIKDTECGFFGSLKKASGTMNVAENTYIDGDTNDPGTPLIPNNGNFDWQDLFTPAYVAGFVTADPTGEPGQRFETESDEGDLYRISLRKGERISLEIADSDPSKDGGDLDLWLYDVNNTDDPADSSLGTGNEETVYAPETGDYYVWVWAQDGKSNYILRTGWDTNTQANSLTVNADMVSDQIFVGYAPTQISKNAASQSQTAKTFAFDEYNDEMQLTRLSSSSDGAALYDIYASYVDMRSAFEFPLMKNGFGISDHRKWVVVKTAKKLLQKLDVQFAGPNYLSSTSAIPNDFLFPNQWHYKSIGLERAWDITTGSKDVIVAVIDSGVAPHFDLVGNVDYDLGFDFVRNSFLYPSGDGDGIDPDASDPGGGFRVAGYTSHGTHVAGTVGAMSNNDVGVAGVNWSVTIMPIRAADLDRNLSCDAIINSLKWAGGIANSSLRVPEKRADIINMSFSGPVICPGLQSIIDQLTNMGIILVAAAGNDDSFLRFYPAALPGVVSVSATNRSDWITTYSNYGSTIDVAAPGGEHGDSVLSTAAVNDPYSSDYWPRFRQYPGTSMAAPHVAGVAGLMKSVFPSMTATDFDYALTSGELTDDLAINGATVKDNYFGYGRINANKAVNWALEASNQGQRETFITSSASALDFGINETGVLIEVGKSGPANIAFETWYREDDWVSLEVVNTDSSAFGTYRVVVNRAGLQRGQYRSTLVFEANDKSFVRVTLSLQVGESVAGEAGQQYALLLDAYTLVPQYWWGGNQQSVDYDVKFEGVVPSLYYLIMGSDMDLDQYICDEGEFCQIYPIDSDPKLIEITSEDYSLGSFTISIPSPNLGATQASAVLVDENGTVEKSSDAFKDFSGRFGRSGWRIER